MIHSTDLVAITPKDVLTFRLKKKSSPKVVFTITNVSQTNIVFKVKTTKPTFYFVRPNQQVLKAGAAEEISVVLVDTECMRVLERAEETGEVEPLEKHRFLVLSKAIEDSEYENIVSNCHNGSTTLSSQEKQEEFAKLWREDNDVDKKKSIKMTVEFIYPTLLSSIPPSPERKVENTVQHDLIQTQVHEVADRSAASVAHKNNRSLTSSHASTEFDVNDLAILKSKYDTIVEYTVHLTAERDMIVTQLEVLKREYNNEINKTKKNKNSASSKNKEQDMESKRPQGTTGFSTMVMLLVAFICFLLGRYS